MRFTSKTFASIIGGTALLAPATLQVLASGFEDYKAIDSAKLVSTTTKTRSLSAPTSSPSPTTSNPFTHEGVGFCVDSSGEWFAGLSSVKNEVPYEDCVDWCSQNIRPTLVAAETGSNGFCYCSFSGCVPADIALTDYSPAAGDWFSGGGVGAVSSADGSGAANCYSHDNFVPGCLPTASKVKLQSLTDRPIQVFEVQVFSSGTNVALGKSATQGSTYKNKAQFVASMSVDGDVTTFSHTHPDTCAWLEIDLGDSYEIESIEIKNRWCANPSDPNGCLCRLSNAAVSFFDDGGNWVSGVSLGNTCGEAEVEHVFTPSPDFCLCHA